MDQNVFTLMSGARIRRLQGYILLSSAETAFLCELKRLRDKYA